MKTKTNVKAGMALHTRSVSSIRRPTLQRTHEED